MRRLLAVLSSVVMLSQLASAQEALESPAEPSTREPQTESGETSHRVGEARVGEIEKGEADRIARRHRVLRHTVFGFGPYGSSNVGEKKVLYGISYAKRWEVTTTGEIALDLLGTFNEEGYLFNAAVGFNYLPFATDFSPLFGAAFGLGAANANRDKTDGAGFSGQFSAGVRTFRWAEAQMEFVGSYTTIFVEDTPGVFGAQLRVLF